MFWCKSDPFSKTGREGVGERERRGGGRRDFDHDILTMRMRTLQPGLKTDMEVMMVPNELFLVPASAPRLVYQGCGTYYPFYGMVHIK